MKEFGTGSSLLIYGSIRAFYGVALEIDYAQLLFAAEVRKLAMVRYEKMYENASRAAGYDHRKMLEWERKNEFSGFEDSALQSILSTAAHIEGTIAKAKETLAQKGK